MQTILASSATSWPELTHHYTRYSQTCSNYVCLLSGQPQTLRRERIKRLMVWQRFALLQNYIYIVYEVANIFGSVETNYTQSLFVLLTLVEFCIIHEEPRWNFRTLFRTVGCETNRKRKGRGWLGGGARRFVNIQSTWNDCPHFPAPNSGSLKAKTVVSQVSGEMRFDDI